MPPTLERKALLRLPGPAVPCLVGRPLAFELVFAPDLGPIRLRVRGAEGVKKFIEEELAHSGQKGSTIF